MLHKKLSMRTSKSNFQSKEVDVSTKMPSIWVNDILFHPSQILWKKHAEIVIPISPLPKNPPHFGSRTSGPWMRKGQKPSTRPYPTQKIMQKTREKHEWRGTPAKGKYSWKSWGDLGQVPCFSAYISHQMTWGNRFVFPNGSVATFGDPKHLPPNGLFVAFLEWASYLKNYLSTYGISFPFVPVHTIITTYHIQQKHKKYFDLFKRRNKQIYDLSIAPQTTPDKPWTSDCIPTQIKNPHRSHVSKKNRFRTCLRKLWSITTKQTMCETWQLQKVLGIAITRWR